MSKGLDQVSGSIPDAAIARGTRTEPRTATSQCSPPTTVAAGTSGEARSELDASGRATTDWWNTLEVQGT